MTYADDNNNGIVATNEIKEENHYYPYGLKHVGYGATPTLTNDAKKYKYNGKEEQEELGLNVIAMDFRQYDNALGRFLCIDALSEKNHYLSPYNFADGNPVFFNDPSGLDSGMPSWLQDMWDATPNGYNTTWTNMGDGNFEVTAFWGSGQQINQSISAGGSGGGGGSSSGGGGIAGFGIGSTYNVNNGILTTTTGNMYANIASGTRSWNTKTGGDWQSVDLPGVFVTGKLGKTNVNYNEITSNINAVLGRINDIANGLGIGTGIIDELWMTATYLNYRTARNPWTFNSLRPTQQNWRINNTLGRFGSKMLNVVKGVGVVGGIVQIGVKAIEIENKGYATKRDIADLTVNTVGLLAVAFLGGTPIGWAIGAGALIYSVGTTIYDNYNP